MVGLKVEVPRPLATQFAVTNPIERALLQHLVLLQKCVSPDVSSVSGEKNKSGGFPRKDK